MAFSALGLSPKIVSAVQQCGYTTPTPIQESAIPVILQGHDLIGIAQTGTGKTAAFSLPILDKLLSSPPQQGGRKPRVLILAPTRELAAQIHENVVLFSRGTQLRATAIYGGVGERPQIDAVRRGVDILVATPGRLIDLMGAGHVTLSKIEYAVLDEADRMLDMGFLPQIRRVIAQLPNQRQTLLFSATLSKEIEKVAGEVLISPKVVEIGRRSNPTDTVLQILHPVSKAKKLDLLLQLLGDDKLDSVLVFSRTKHGADKIARKLAQAGISTATLHSNKSQSQRQRALAGFKDGSIHVLVATDIAARGIDVEEISHVINFDFPPQPEDYVHRIGRTGRAGLTGDAISFVTADDESSVRLLEKMIGRRIERKHVAGFEQGGPEPKAAPGSQPPRFSSRSDRGRAPRPAGGASPAPAIPGQRTHTSGARPQAPGASRAQRPATKANRTRRSGR